MALPTEPVREGSRWRYVRPSSEEVAEWFRTVPLDEGMKHEDFVSGIVLIPAQEKVKKQVENANGRLGIIEEMEMTFTPYVRVDTRVTYFRKLAEKNDQIAVIEPVYVPTIKEKDTHARNDNMPPGFWWHIAPTTAENFVRYVCCTMRVALYDKQAWIGNLADAPLPEGTDASRLASVIPRPLREGVATKQVPVTRGNYVDENMLHKAETGAVGRALGIAGILVIGTGIATAEDLAEVREQAAVELPEQVRASEAPEALEARLMGLQAALKAEFPEIWEEISGWWNERCAQEGWNKLADAPLDVRRALATRMTRRLENARAQNSSQDQPEEDVPSRSRESQK